MVILVPLTVAHAARKKPTTTIREILCQNFVFLMAEIPPLTYVYDKIL
jgi:hypothetical protein